MMFEIYITRYIFHADLRRSSIFCIVGYVSSHSVVFDFQIFVKEKLPFINFLISWALNPFADRIILALPKFLDAFQHHSSFHSIRSFFFSCKLICHSKIFYFGRHKAKLPWSESRQRYISKTWKSVQILYNVAPFLFGFVDHDSPFHFAVWTCAVIYPS